LFKNTHEDIEKIPRTSGLYYFYDKDDKLLYIGRAKNLRGRTSEHHYYHLLHREGMFFRKILLSKGLLDKDENEWPKELTKSWSNFQIRILGKFKPIVIDYIFDKVKRIEIEEMPHELTQSKEEEKIIKLKPPFNHQTATEEYYRLSEDME